MLTRHEIPCRPGTHTVEGCTLLPAVRAVGPMEGVRTIQLWSMEVQARKIMLARPGAEKQAAMLQGPIRRRVFVVAEGTAPAVAFASYLGYVDQDGGGTLHVFSEVK